jgi:serine/threonine protein phosphatase PrpC
LKFASVTRCQGLSDHMEDEFVVVTDTKNIKKSANENYSFFGVFDGNNKCTVKGKHVLISSIVRPRWK